MNLITIDNVCGKDLSPVLAKRVGISPNQTISLRIMPSREERARRFEQVANLRHPLIFSNNAKNLLIDGLG